MGKVISRRRMKLLILACLCATVIAAFVYRAIYAFGLSFSYGDAEVVDTTLDTAGDRLYVSYHSDNAVVEIDTATMKETRRFGVNHPSFIELSPQGDFLYALSHGLTCRLLRIRLSDGHMDAITLDGFVSHFCQDSPGETLWVVGGVWPAHGDLVDYQEVQNHPGTGRITEVDASTFSITRTAVIDPIPVSVWHSSYSDCLYTLHEIRVVEVYSPEDFMSRNPVTVHERDSLEEVSEFLGGFQDLGTFPPAQLTAWDDAGRYLAIPDPLPGDPKRHKSIHVVDTGDNSVAFTLSFPWYYGADAIGIRFAHKVPGHDVLWAVAYHGIHDESIADHAQTAMRVNTATQEYEFFAVEGVTDHFGDFAVSPDGETLYFPVIRTGEVIVWSPPE